MGFLSSTSSKYYLNHATKSYPFMTCIVKVNTQSQWQRTVTKVLDKCCGVHSFRMDDNGVVEISGTVDPSLLLKMMGKAGRSAELCWFQFGECSSNLFMQTSQYDGGTTSYSGDGRYLHAQSLSRPKLPLQLPSVNTTQNYGYGYDHDNHCCAYYGNKNDYCNDHGYGYPHSHYQQQQQQRYDHRLDDSSQQSYHYQYGYRSAGHSHGRNQIQNRSALPSRCGEDIGCCRVM